jgi:hypothetical protein
MSQWNTQSVARLGTRFLVLAFLLVEARCAFSQGGNGNDLSTTHRQTTSIGDSLRRAGDAPLHILYLHGIGATGPQDSLPLRQSICKELKDCTSPAGYSRGREYADQGEFALTAKAPTLTYMGSVIWNNQQEWNASAPFVDHYVLTRKTGKSILVDEINWWPLVFPLKCRNILPEEAKLAGTDGNYLNLCATLAPDIVVSGRYDYYPWIALATAKTLESEPSKAVVLNRKLKIDLMDWGFSDALLSVGPVRELLVEGIRQLIIKSVAASGDQAKALSAGAGSPGASDSEYMVISHSLGSFLAFSALNSQSEANVASAIEAANRAKVFDYVLAHMDQVYLFANQVPLLELAQLGQGSAAPTPGAMAEVPGSETPEATVAQAKTAGSSRFMVDLENWTAKRAATQRVPGPLARVAGRRQQIVAWSDPNDLLSWQLPDSQGINIVNLHPKNSIRWLWLFENPMAARDNYAANKDVIRALLKPKETAP